MWVSVNKVKRSVRADSDTQTLWVNGDEWGLLDTKYGYGYGIGVCGTCTVHLDSILIRSCVYLIAYAREHQITTIEGLSQNDTHPTQEAWAAEKLPQCGCGRSGHIMNATALLTHHHNPDDIDRAMAGHIGRCRSSLSLRVPRAGARATDRHQHRDVQTLGHRSIQARDFCSRPRIDTRTEDPSSPSLISWRLSPMITGLLLAAGRSQRFGTPKLIHRLADDAPLAIHSARSLREAVDRAVAVVGPDDTALAIALRQHGFEVVCCPDSVPGQGASLAFGVRVTGGSAGWLVALAGMPYIESSSAQAVADKIRAGALIAAPSFNGRHGHPVGFGRALGPQLGALTDDTGALALIKAHRHLLTLIPCSDANVLTDVDLPGDIWVGPNPATQNGPPERLLF